MARNKYDVDEIIEEQFDVHQLLRLGKYVAPHKKKMFLAAVLMLSSSALTMLIPIFFMRVIDQCIPERDMNGIWWGIFCPGRCWPFTPMPRR